MASWAAYYLILVPPAVVALALLIKPDRPDRYFLMVFCTAGFVLGLVLRHALAMLKSTPFLAFEWINRIYFLVLGLIVLSACYRYIWEDQISHSGILFEGMIGIAILAWLAIYTKNSISRAKSFVETQA